MSGRGSADVLLGGVGGAVGVTAGVYGIACGGDGGATCVDGGASGTVVVCRAG